MTTFNFTGGGQTFTVPPSVTSLTAELWGAAGFSADSAVAPGGYGGYLKATIAVTPGEVLNILVGGQGSFGLGGFNGGGARPTDNGGGGATDIRQGGGALSNRVAVAGGGGGPSWQSGVGWFRGGDGGGLTGQTGTGTNAGSGGTQSAGGAYHGGGAGTSGALGLGGQSDASPFGHSHGGGGGGYWGGGGGTVDAGAGGGSSFSSGTIITNTQGGNDGNGKVVISYALPPLAPSLTSPANGSTIDATAGVTFTGRYNPDPGNSVNANGRALRKIVAGVTSYWNQSSSSWVGGPLYNPVSIAPGAAASLGPITTGLANGQTIQFSMSDQESSGNLQGAWATDFVVTLSTGPVLAINYPTGAVSDTNTPALRYTPTPGPGSSIIGGRWLIYTAPHTVDIGGGVIPGGALSDATWGGNPLTVPMSGAGLLNGVTYYAYAAVEESGALWSTTVLTIFTVNLSTPAAATITASPFYGDPTDPDSIELNVQGHDNICSADDASFETTAGTAVATTNCTVLRQLGGSGMDGNAGLAVNQLAAGDMVFTQGPFPVSALSLYSWLTHANGDGNLRTVRIDAVWYNGATLLSTTAGTPVAEVWTGTFATSWKQAVGSGIAPATATQVYLVTHILATGVAEGQHIIDEVGVFPGVVTTWSRGGLRNQTILSILRSDGQYVMGFSDVDRHAIPWPSQQLVINDVEIESGVDYTYTAVVGAVITLPATLAPPAVSNDASLTLTGWDIMDPTDPSSWVPLQLQGDSRIEDEPEVQGIFRPLGRKTAVVVRGDMLAPEFDLPLMFYEDGDVAWQDFAELRRRQVTVMLRGDMPGDLYYVALGATRPMQLMRTSGRIQQPVRNLVIHCTPTDRPQI